MLHVPDTVVDVAGVITAVSNQFATEDEVGQVVAVPMSASFPMYDFFLLHRIDEQWVVAAGYQCKKGSESPTEHALTKDIIRLSVWIEGKCRNYRVATQGARMPAKIELGWHLLGEPVQTGVLGVSVSEALPRESTVEECPQCPSEQALKHQQELGAQERSRKRSIDNR
jgi:hypothetical protein